MRRQPPCLVSSPCQATMAELQEVQITEEKPLLPGQTPEAAKVTGDPLASLPQSQPFKHSPCLLASKPVALILMRTPAFSTSTHLSSHTLQSGT